MFLLGFRWLQVYMLFVWRGLGGLGLSLWGFGALSPKP